MMLGGKIMKDKLEILNFLQDFGCAKLYHLQSLCGDDKDNFKYLLNNTIVSKKGDIFVHNTKSINNKMLIALDVLCKFKNRISKFYIGYDPILITFLTKENFLYHIIVADEDNSKGVIKLVNSCSVSLPQADKLILAFPNKEAIKNIDCEIPFLFCVYPHLEIIND